MKKFAVIAVLAIFMLPHPIGFAEKSENKIADMIDSVDENMLYYYDKTIQDFGPHPTWSEKCNEVAEFIYNEFEDYGLETEYQEWEYRGLKGRNVIATLPGEDNATVIISAHYDSVADSPGADDDASGIACLLMAAKIMASYSFQHTIKFVAFSGEEQGRYGSKVFARNAYENNEIVIADLQLDGVGHAVSREGGSKIRISSNEASTWISDIVEEVSERYRSKIGLDIVRQRNFPGSDHQSFIEYGYEANFFLEYEFNPYYHSPQDTVENVNFSYLAKVCKLAIATLASLADKDINIMVRFVEPERGAIYFGERKLIEIPSHHTIIFGRIHASVDILGMEKVERVEFYFDGELRGVVEEKPYDFMYGKIAFFKHTIKALAIGEENDMNEIDVMVFNILPKHWLK